MRPNFKVRPRAVAHLALAQGHPCSLCSPSTTILATRTCYIVWCAFMRSWTGKDSESYPNATIATMLIALTNGCSPTLRAHFVETRSVLLIIIGINMVSSLSFFHFCTLFSGKYVILSTLKFLWSWVKIQGTFYSFVSYYVIAFQFPPIMQCIAFIQPFSLFSLEQYFTYLTIAYSI